MDISKILRARLTKTGVPFSANDSIHQHVSADELVKLEHELTTRVQAMLDTLLIDTANDHNTEGTAARVAKMYLREVFAGRYVAPPVLTDFPNARRLDEIYTVGPVAVRSACSHHFCPIEGQLWCGVVPSERVIGISKFARLARHFMARPQIQEEATVQLADELERLLKPRGLAVVVRARHSCMTWRGVQENATVMTTSVTRGLMRESSASRAECFALFASQGFVT